MEDKGGRSRGRGHKSDTCEKREWEEEWQATGQLAESPDQANR